MTRAITYLRVSTDEQETIAQIDTCTRFAITNKLTMIGPFSDDGLSGATNLDKRVGLWDAIQELRRGDVLLVARRDRLAREDYIRHQIIKLVEKRGARVVSAAGEGNGDDADDPTNYIARSMADMIATYERLVTKARTRAALAAKIRRGQQVGSVRFGYDVSRTEIIRCAGKEKIVRYVAENADEQAVIQQMREWRAEGQGWLGIAKRLSSVGVRTKTGKPVWTARGVKLILTRRVAVEAV